LLAIMKLSIVVSLIIASASAFVFKSLTMNRATVEQCCFCDDKSNYRFDMAVAEELRKYFSERHLKMTIMQNDIRVSFQLPNEQLDTGHSCKVRSEARNVNVNGAMVRDEEYLDANLNDPEPVFFTAFFGGKVKHNTKVTLDVRNRFGFRFFGSCRRLGTKTCEDIEATSSGTNVIAVQMDTSNLICFPRNGQQWMRFRLNVSVFEDPIERTYTDPRVNTKDCRIRYLDPYRINSKVKSMTRKYLKKTDVRPIVSDRIMRELERILKAKMGEEIKIPINVTEGSGRRKRAIGCRKKVCPRLFHRIGNTEMCKRNFGRRRPNCSSYARNARLKSRRVWVWTFYWCEAPRIAA